MDKIGAEVPKTEEVLKAEEVDQLEDDDFYDPEPDGLDSEGATEIHDTPLQPPSVQMLTTEKLHAMIHEGAIDIEPPYQRDVVWPEAKQIALIDSVFRNFFIPPVIFAVQVDDEGQETRVCVDGKQRLTSIQRFFDGLISHKDTRTKKHYWFTVSPKNQTTRAQVPPHLKQVFRGIKIPVVEYHGIAPGTEREIFQRVQLGMPLTAAEKLQAVSSPWSEWISHLELKHVSHDNGLAERLCWDTKRGRDFQNVAHMVFCCDGLPEELLPTAQKIEKWMSREAEPTHQFKDDIDNVLRCLWLIATSPKYNEGFTKVPQRIAPVEFIFIGVLLYVLRQEPYEVQGKAIYTLRRTIRDEYKDIRNNSDVGKAMWRYINALRAEPHSSLTHNAASLPKNKRKRNSGYDNDDDDEFRPKPTKGTGKTVKTRANQTR